MAVIFTSVAYTSLFAPLVILWCLSGRTSKQKLKQIQLKVGESDVHEKTLFIIRVCTCTSPW